MASFLDKTKINTAVEKSTKMPFLNTHITTANFMEFNVALCTELAPKQSINVKQDCFVRLEPMPAPTMGDLKLNNRAYFVPYRTVWPVFNDFYEDVEVIDDGGIPYSLSSVPTVSDSVFRELFTQDAFSTVVILAAEKSDFVVVDGSNVQTRRKFTTKGKRFYKMLRQLGYTIDFNENNRSFNHSAMALLCATKVYCDWFAQSAYMFDPALLSIQKLFQRRNTFALTKNELLEILNTIDRVKYDSDYFVSAWDNPTNPNDGSFSNFVINDISKGTNTNYNRKVVVGGSTAAGQTDAPVMGGGPEGTSTFFTSSTTTISQYMLNTLRAVTDWMKRHQIAGSRTVDRMLAQWGIKLDAAKLDRSIYCGSKTQPILFGDVTSNADTEGANLGDYAGKGVGFSERTFDFSTDEFGMFFIISTIVPEVSYYQGEARQNMRLSRFDFYQPEFDNLGVQAISRRELICPLDGNLTSGVSEWDTQVFGFTPRYSDYKFMLDKVTGDYVAPSISVGQDSWFLGRNLESFINKDAPVPMTSVTHSIFFGDSLDAEQYNRIFYNTDAFSDKFRVKHTFEGHTIFPGKSLYDTYEFEDKGEKVTLDVNGVKMN